MHMCALAIPHHDCNHCTAIGVKLVVYKHTTGGVAATMTASKSIMDYGVMASNIEIKEQLLKHRVSP